MVLPSLARAIGLNEAVCLQQVHYWLQTNRQHFHEGRFWCYNSIREWRETNFPFWSEDTIKRVFKKLRQLGLLLVGNFNRLKIDQTLWYSIDYEAVEALEVESPIRADCPNGNSNLPQPIPETTSEGISKSYSESTPVSTRPRAPKGRGKWEKVGWTHAGGDNLFLRFQPKTNVKKDEPDLDWGALDRAVARQDGMRSKVKTELDKLLGARPELDLKGAAEMGVGTNPAQERFEISNGPALTEDGANKVNAPPKSAPIPAPSRVSISTLTIENSEQGRDELNASSRAA